MRLDHLLSKEKGHEPDRRESRKAGTWEPGANGKGKSGNGRQTGEAGTGAERQRRNPVEGLWSEGCAGEREELRRKVDKHRSRLVVQFSGAGLVRKEAQGRDLERSCAKRKKPPRTMGV